ncbi:MAG: Holliday junction ATP-dependent DNA helicase RuvB [Parcubacteria group bacterium GW2011_GWA2_43_11]|nr:MAG: Holliday junction ATP-dependent DNA helicase RuvB [Parcubacteria group bacterium GW2011_GWA2_43_11]
MSTPSQKDLQITDIPDQWLDKTLRPSVWDEYIGQENVKNNLHVLLEAARERGHAPEHLLLYGPPGLGKTTLAHLIASDLGAAMKITSGPAIERVGDLAAILTNLGKNDILFVDEIHRLNKSIEEVLYPALESGVLDIIIGKGPSARTIQLELPPFTLIAATTRIALLSAPLRSRFSGGVFRLEFYTNEEISRIVKRSAHILGVSLDDTAAEAIALRSRFTPRTANYLLKRCRDFAQVHKRLLDRKLVEESLDQLGFDALGLQHSDRHLLRTIIEKFAGGPVGLSTLGAATAEEDATIEEVYEPYLIRSGLLERTPRGRIVTPLGYAHLNIPYPEEYRTQNPSLGHSF